MSNLAKYRSLSKTEKRLFREALRRMYWTKIELLFVSFKKLAKKHASVGTKELNSEELLSIKRAILQASKFAFWKNICLVNTLTARKMLNKKAVASHASLGVRKDENGELIAHSWLVCQSIEIVDKGAQYKELHSF